MRRAWRATLAVLAAALICGGAPAPAEGQKPAASAQPKAEKPAEKGDKGDKAKPADKKPSDPDGLPAGHPPVGDGLPAGHPPVDDDDAPPDRGGNPHGGGQERKMFRPPADGAQEDPSLPPGTLIATIRDADDKPIPGARITLDILHSTVAKGDTSNQLTRDADATGSARFDKLDVGSGVRYRVSTAQGGATYAVGSIVLNDTAGKRAVVHAYPVTNNMDDVTVFSQGDVYVTLREDSFQVEQSVLMLNASRIAWAPNESIALPKGYKAFNKQETPDGIKVEDTGGGVVLKGVVAPGEHGAGFHYQVSFEDSERQTIRIELPPNVVQSRVIVEASKSMSIAVPGYPAAQRNETRDGRKVLVTMLRVGGDKPPSRIVELTISGLPTKGSGRWIALALAALSLVAGAAYFLQKGGDSGLDADARGDLREAREALLGELVALEKAHKSGEIGPKSYARIRAALVDALARVMSMIDDARPAAARPAARPDTKPGASARKPKRRDGRSAEPSA